MEKDNLPKMPLTREDSLFNIECSLIQLKAVLYREALDCLKEPRSTAVSDRAPVIIAADNIVKQIQESVNYIRAESIGVVTVQDLRREMADAAAPRPQYHTRLESGAR